MRTRARSSLPALLAFFVVVAAAQTSAASCRVVLGDEAGRQVGSVRCGEKLPDIAWTVGWIEDAARISPFAFTRDRLESSAGAAGALVPGASVLAPKTPGIASVIVFTPDSERPEGAVAFRRWMKPGEQVSVPAGRVFAISFDEKDRPNGIASVASIAAGKTRELRFDRDADRLVVELSRPARHVASNDDLGEVQLELEDHRRVTPSSRSTGAERTFLVWDGQPASAANLRITSAKYFLRQTAVRLPRGVLGIRAVLEPLPTLKVRVSVDPFDAIPADEVLTVSLTDGPNLLRTLQLRPNAEVDVEAMPLSVIEAKLSMGDVHFTRRQDLSSGVDEAVSFDLEPLVVEGKLQYGGEQAEGEVAFTGDGDSARVETAGGKYKATVWEKRRYGVVVKLHGHPELPAHTDTIRIDESRTFDIDIPRSMLLVSVLDDETDAGIPDAFVYAKNNWVTPEGEKRGAARTSRTDKSGQCTLPPLRVGDVEIIATAEGYEKADPVVRQVTASDLRTAVQIRLKPLHAMDTVRVVLPSGAPAAGAKFALFGEDMRQVFANGTADELGEVKLAANARGVLLLIHPQGGGVARAWTGSTGGSPATVQMPPRTGRQVFRVSRPNGEKAASARIVLLLDGVLVTGGGLSFLTGTPSASGIDGVWIADGLPAGPVRATAMTVRYQSQISLREVESFSAVLRSDTPILTID